MATPNEDKEDGSVDLVSSQIKDRLTLGDDTASPQSQNPFALIPLEVFQRIIHFALGDPAYPIQIRIVQLSLVCKSWRDGVVGGVPYWTQIDYISGEPSWQADINKARRFWVLFTYDQALHGEADIVPFLRLILNNIDRCCLLSLALAKVPKDDSEEKKLLDAILHHPAPVLQTFKIAVPQRFVSIIRPQDRNLEINARFISWQSGILERLTSLKVEQHPWEQLPADLVSMDRLVDIIRNSSGLQYLSILNLTLTSWTKKPSVPLIMPDLHTISLTLPLNFTSHFLSLLVAPRCTWFAAECNMEGSTIDALLGPACHSLNDLFGSRWNPTRASVFVDDRTVHFSCGSFTLVLDDIKGSRAAIDRCLSFYQQTSLRNVKELELSAKGTWLDVLSLLEGSLPSVETLTLQQIPQDEWEGIIEYLSRSDGPQCWPHLDGLVVLAGNPPYWKFSPHHFLNFLCVRLEIPDASQTPKRKFGRLVARGLFHRSFKETGTWNKFRSLVEHVNMSERVGYLLHANGL
ncbi:hypothetical protein FRB99_002034 [Tulasnella sp. 403]|nr:hypothetical protein FRB99_002034 [Tulasnella sp. 403]